MIIPFHNLATQNNIVFISLPTTLYTSHSAFRSWRFPALPSIITTDAIDKAVRFADENFKERRLPFKLLLLPPLPLHQGTPQGPASVVKYGQKLQRAYAKLKPGEKVDFEKIQRFIRGSIASDHTLELTARDLKAIQEATTARAKRASLGGQGWDYKSQRVSPILFEKKGKEEEQARKRKEREEKRAEKQANSQLAQIEFLIGGVPPVE